MNTGVAYWHLFFSTSSAGGKQSNLGLMFPLIGMRALRRDWTRLGPVVAMRDVLAMEQARLLLKGM